MNLQSVFADFLMFKVSSFSLWNIPVSRFSRQMYEKRLKLRFARGWSPTQIAKNKNWRGVRFRFFEKSKKAKNWSIGLSGYKGTSAADQSGSPSYCFDQGLYPTGGFSPGTDHGLRLQTFFDFDLNSTDFSINNRVPEFAQTLTTKYPRR